MSMTLTIEVPDDLAARLPRTEEERKSFALDALWNEVEEQQPGTDQEYELTQEDLDAIGRGLADSDAGRVVDGREAMAKFRAERGWPAREKR